MELRAYQIEAKAAFYEYLESQEGNPCVVIPTAGGKTPLLASICADAHNLWQGRVIILAHVKELLEQARDKLLKTDPALPVGVYSAGLKLRDRNKPITVAGIQSVHAKAHIFEPFDLIIVDEAHRIPTGGDGMYRTFLEEAKITNPNVRVLGLTATPYRLDSGLICGKENILNEICYEVGVKELMRDGYICKVKSRKGSVKIDLSGVHVRAGEFKPDEMSAAFDQVDLVKASCAEIVKLTEGRKGILVFCCLVEHGQHVADELRSRNVGEVAFVCGETPADDRAKIIEDFKAQRIRFLVNVNVFTEGFDATHVDCVVLLRATLSPGLYYQMVGRGFRLHPGKEDCLVLDYGHNIARHGPVDAIIPGKKPGGGETVTKECPNCMLQIPAGATECPECGAAMPRDPRKPSHEIEASDKPIVSSDIHINTFDVIDVRYGLHTKRGTKPGEAPPTLRADYQITDTYWQSEWVCIEHSGYAREKARTWWKKRTTAPMPETVLEAVKLAQRGWLAMPTRITVKETAGDNFPRITFAEIAAPIDPDAEWEKGNIKEDKEDEWSTDHADQMPDKVCVNDNDIPF